MFPYVRYSALVHQIKLLFSMACLSGILRCNSSFVTVLRWRRFVNNIWCSIPSHDFRVVSVKRVDGLRNDPLSCTRRLVTVSLRRTTRSCWVVSSWDWSIWSTQSVVTWVKVGFHYPSWRSELTGVKKCTRVLGPSTRPVNSGRELG